MFECTPGTTMSPSLHTKGKLCRRSSPATNCTTCRAMPSPRPRRKPPWLSSAGSKSPCRGATMAATVSNRPMKLRVMPHALPNRLPSPSFKTLARCLAAAAPRLKPNRSNSMRSSRDCGCAAHQSRNSSPIALKASATRASTPLRPRPVAAAKLESGFPSVVPTPSTYNLRKATVPAAGHPPAG
ncbi:hypothetical protein D3C81_1576270 [compost metagenome]